MPRTKIGIPWEQQELESELRKRYGGFMSRAEIGKEIGKSRPTVLKWIEGMRAYHFDKITSRYDVRDVAKRIYESKEK